MEVKLEFRPFKIGKYLLLERLATGGMAEVYRAKASGAGGFEKQMAIKRILPNYSSNEEFRKMFEYEARLSSSLTHANIVQVYDFVKSGETYLLAMEYVNGKNLRQFLNKAKKVGVSVPIEFAVYVINEVCKGLEYAHSKKDDVSGKALNIIHRDMSPQNVMLSYEGAVKIVDFGIAKAKDRVDETRSGVIKGKFGYMSPEQANGDSVDNRTDIFSTGIILFELLTGRRLFAAESDLATLRQIQECVIPQPSRINPKVTSDLEKIVLTSLAKDLTTRFKTAGDFHRALLEYANRHFPAYTQREASALVEKVFNEEIEVEKKRYEQLLRQSIPFSQGAAAPKTEMTDVESALEGTQTNTDIGQEDEPITLSGSENAQPENHEPVQGNIGDWVQRPEGGTAAYTVNDKGSMESVSLDDPPTPGESTLIKDENRFTQTHQLGSMDGEQEEEEGDSEDPAVPNQTVAGAKPDAKPRSGIPDLQSPLSLEPKKLSSFSELNKVALDNQELVRGDRTQTGIKTQVGISTPRQPTGHRQLGMKKSPTRDGLFDPSPAPAAEQRKRRALPTPLALGMALFVTVYAYRYFMDGSVRNWLESQDLRGPTQVSGENTEPLFDPSKKPMGNCALKVETDPPGADIFVGGEPRGLSPTTISGNCNQPLKIRVKLQGHEEVSEVVTMNQTLNEFYRVLKRAPMGTLELVVDRNVDVYINGEKIGTADANQMTELKLRASPQYEIRLVSLAFRLQATRTVSITEGKVTHLSVRLEDARPTTKR